MTASKPGLDRAASELNSGAIHLLRSLAVVDREAGLTPARLSALSVLVFGGPRTLGRLAAAEGVAGPTMTRIVDGLIGAGLAERRPHPRDRRAVTVAATAAGERLMRAAQRRRIDAISSALAGLAPAERRAVVRAAGMLDRVAGMVRNPAAGRSAGGRQVDREPAEASDSAGVGLPATSRAHA